MKEQKNNFPVFKTGNFQTNINHRLSKMEEENFSLRLWRKDYTLFKNDSSIKKSVESFMGWLNTVEEMESSIPQIQKFVSDLEQSDFRDIVLIGMGGSSLAPIVLQKSFPGLSKYSFTVLDTTDPQTIIDAENKINISQTLFIVASKSGTTIEIGSLFSYFYEKVKLIKGIKAGDNFVSITDPGTVLAAQSIKLNFRYVFRNSPEIGGRFSALSFFGLIPAAILGIDVQRILKSALEMTHACSSHAMLSKNPGVVMGVTIAELAKAGKDKLTFIIDEPISSFGLWLEQLIAESTGKEGLGVFPVPVELFNKNEIYGQDRVFVYYKHSGSERGFDSDIQTLTRQGHPVIIIPFENSYDLGAEFFKWEIATATIGALLGINPFDQPNVQENKDITNSILEKLNEGEYIFTQKPVSTEGDISYYFHAENNDKLIETGSFLRDVAAGDYISIQAYLQENPDTNKLLEEIRLTLFKSFGVPVTIGYGPRFLHSTGQYHKGGPNKGHFIQLTSDEKNDISIPGKSYTFGTLKRAQAMGDFQVLGSNKRKVMRVDIKNDILKGLREFKFSVERLNKKPFEQVA